MTTHKISLTKSKKKFDKEESSLAEEEPVIFEEGEEPSEEIIIDFGAEATEGQEEKAVEIDSQEEK